MLLNSIYFWELINKELKPRMENVSDVVKRDIFKGIVALILLNKFTIVFFNF